MSRRKNKNKQVQRAILVGIGGGSVPVLGSLVLIILVVVAILAAAGGILGWLWGGGIPSSEGNRKYGSHRGSSFLDSYTYSSALFCNANTGSSHELPSPRAGGYGCSRGNPFADQYFEHQLSANSHSLSDPDKPLAHA